MRFHQFPPSGFDFVTKPKRLWFMQISFTLRYLKRTFNLSLSIGNGAGKYNI